MLQALIIDGDGDFRRRILESWSLPDSELLEGEPGPQVGNLLEQRDFQVLFLDADGLWQDGLDLVSFARSALPGAEIVVLARPERLDEARAAVARGASQYLVKPLEARELADVARHAQMRALSLRTFRGLESHVLEELLGDTAEMRKVLWIAQKVAPTTSTVLITGESGTGKEFLANIIHRLSPRAEAPFVAVNCGALPEALIESELFGVRKGAFTGAHADRKGLFEEAETGTLFLDEVGELPPNAQVKLLRFLQNHEVRRVGDSDVRAVDVRVVAATNRDLQQAVREGRFREDLFFRLNVFHLALPPLRHRRETIPQLVRFFVHKFNQLHGRRVTGIARDAQEILWNHDYPGNIRELENLVEHAVVLAEGERIRLADLPEALVRAQPLLELPPSLSVDAVQDRILPLSEIERQHILHVLARVGNNQSEAAQRLGISRSTLWRKLKEHDIAL